MLQDTLRISLIRLNSILNKVLEYTPERLKRHIKYYKFKAKVHLLDASLINEEALEREYRRALRSLVETTDANDIGDYLEFGVYYGASLSVMHRVLQEEGLNRVRLFGFDSFEGLPQAAAVDDEGHWRPGQFAANYRFAQEYLTAQGVDPNRVVLTKGWFRDTLNKALKEKHRLTKASVIMIDCDMYLSAKQALDFCAPLIKDQAFFFFDDWNSGQLAERGLGEKRAFDEFMEEHPQLGAEAVGTYTYRGRPNGKIFRLFKTAAPETTTFQQPPTFKQSDGAV